MALAPESYVPLEGLPDAVASAEAAIHERRHHEAQVYGPARSRWQQRQLPHDDSDTTQRPRTSSTAHDLSLPPLPPDLCYPREGDTDTTTAVGSSNAAISSMESKVSNVSNVHGSLDLSYRHAGDALMETLREAVESYVSTVQYKLINWVPPLMGHSERTQRAVASVLMATSCLAAAFLGVYFFTYWLRLSCFVVPVYGAIQSLAGSDDGRVRAWLKIVLCSLLYHYTDSRLPLISYVTDLTPVRVAFMLWITAYEGADTIWNVALHPLLQTLSPPAAPSGMQAKTHKPVKDVPLTRPPHAVPTGATYATKEAASSDRTHDKSTVLPPLNSRTETTKSDTTSPTQVSKR
jgi:hypothetical protein